jgi:hypothetical protein
MFRTWKNWIAWTCSAGQCVPLPPGGQVDQIIEQALEDGVIERHEAEEIMVHHRRHLAAREEEIAAIITLFARKRSDASELQLLASWRVVISGDY